jgi:IclR family transcriptional regulator, acetate operon repressor
MVERERLPPRTTGVRTRPQYPIESVDNALRLLLLLAEQPRVRTTEASVYLGVASSTAHRLLAMLQYHGFVRQDPSSRAYVLGPALSTIAAAINRHADIRSLARPVLERLNSELQETVHLGRLEGQQTYFIDSIESPRAVRVVSRLGLLMPAHCTSTGKAMLSQLSASALRDLYPQEQLETLTERSISTRSALSRELQAIQRRGYATSNQESEEEVASVAVPVRAADGDLYALNVSVPTNRMTPASRASFVAALRQAAADLHQVVS